MVSLYFWIAALNPASDSQGPKLAEGFRSFCDETKLTVFHFKTGHEWSVFDGASRPSAAERSVSNGLSWLRVLGTKPFRDRVGFVFLRNRMIAILPSLGPVRVDSRVQNWDLVCLCRNEV